MIFIVIIAVLIVGLIIILLIYWCGCCDHCHCSCTPCRKQQEEKSRQKEKIIQIEQYADALEKELGKTGATVEDIQKNISKLEKTVEATETKNIDTQKAQIHLEAEQSKIKHDSRKIDESISTLHETLRSQEKRYVDDKFDHVEKSVAQLASSINAKQEKDEIRDEFQKITNTVMSVKDVIDKNENRMGEIIMKIDHLVINDKNHRYFFTQNILIINLQNTLEDNLKSAALSYSKKL